MNKAIVILPAAAIALGGCISSAPKAPDNWVVEFSRAKAAEDALEAPANGGDEKRIVRISQVSVRAPYDGIHMAVLRADGSLAFDPGNAFAAPPGPMLRGIAQDAVVASGLFSRAIASNSSAASDFALEICVTRLALDCRREGRRDATVELGLVLVRGRDIVGSSRAEGRSATGDRDFSAAFSQAFAKAMKAALQDLKVR